MNKRKVCLVGLAAGATLLAGCVAQYQNPSACEHEMRTRLVNASLGQLTVTHTAVAYRGKRVVVEGALARGALPASGVLSPEAVAAVTGAPGASTAGASGVSAANAAVASASTGASAASASSAQHATVASAASGAAVASAASAASGAAIASAASAASGAAVASAASAAAPVAESKPTTPMAVLAVKLGLHKAPRPTTAAECTYDKTGSLTSFRWLSPAALAKTTPAPDASDE
ncbi:hypothetical protein [Paraburkholderia pallida]|uniref:Lipoprotein n=1 Tax=Paraburkholderia pallida TaxID=2547399 RepID=A0A4P7CUV6_9BURK|nr:hypothetical protein [Paraburkholderia pallida]QBQ97929.1 hypothetical protein E1956_12585 [Paraburkholderia pallida]